MQSKNNNYKFFILKNVKRESAITINPRINNVINNIKKKPFFLMGLKIKASKEIIIAYMDIELIPLNILFYINFKIRVLNYLVGGLFL